MGEGPKHPILHSVAHQAASILPCNSSGSKNRVWKLEENGICEIYCPIIRVSALFSRCFGCWGEGIPKRDSLEAEKDREAVAFCIDEMTGK